MFKKGEADHSLIVAALVAFVAIGGLVFFGPASAEGAANIVLPPAATPMAEAKYVEPQLIGNKVAIPPQPMDFLESVGKQAAYDSYVFCREASNWPSYKEKSQCCNVRCATECAKTFGNDPYGRNWKAQEDYDTCKETWCEDMCRNYQYQEIERY